MLVVPGVTPWDGQNPGVGMFEVNSAGVPTALRMEFLNLNATIGKSSVSYEDAEFLSVNFATDFGLVDLDATSLSTFRKVLEADETFTLNYLVAKLGFDSTDSAQFDQAVKLLTDIDLVTTTKHHTGEYICQMHFSITPTEYDTCTASANKSLFLQ